MKLLFCFLLITYLKAGAQQADFIIIKKHNKTIASYYSGMNIAFTAQSGANIDALINGIKDDTLYLQQFIVQYIPTTIGTIIIDTVGSYRYKYHYNQIAAFGKPENKNFNVRGSGAALLGGGALLAIGSGVVYLADRQKFSAPILLTSLGLGTLGYFLAKGKKSKGITIGKKYKIVYMNMSNKK